jgi:hypothetical protein
VVVAVMSRVETDFLDRICELSKHDFPYFKMTNLVKQGVVRQY